MARMRIYYGYFVGDGMTADLERALGPRGTRLLMSYARRGAALDRWMRRVARARRAAIKRNGSRR